jgi:GDP-L-fucose synthase
VTIRGLAEMIRDLVHPTAELTFDTSRPDGMPRKVLDVSKLEALGWMASIPLEEGLRTTYDWYVNALREGNARL